MNICPQTVVDLRSKMLDSLGPIFVFMQILAKILLSNVVTQSLNSTEPISFIPSHLRIKGELGTPCLSFGQKRENNKLATPLLKENPGSDTASVTSCPLKYLY